ncbi:MAG: hypothetical protein AAB677_00690 [Patescibacteria group bacterium]
MPTYNWYSQLSNFLPKTHLGKWSVWLHAFFLIGVGISILLVNGLGLLSYGDRWWDITVPVLGLASLTAFVLGLVAIRKYKESSILVYASVGIGILTILFILLHSLFISD